jgi:membrane protein involved in colicin uptake
MKSRYVVLFLSLVLAIALAVPALGGPTNPVASLSASVKSIANKALKKAKTAQTAANSAQTAAKNAQTTADSAQTAAKNAQTTADAAKSAAAAAQSTANTKLGSTFTEFGSFDGPNTTSGGELVECPGASEVTGGGFETSGNGSNEVVPIYTGSYGDAWLAVLKRIPGGSESWSVRPIVVCAE